MKFFADLHIHSKYSRATSKDMSVETLDKWAQIKGISVIGTGDFTHPKWLDELTEKLQPEGNGLFRLKANLKDKDIPNTCKTEIFFMLTAEISCIYKKFNKIRKIHCIVLADSFTSVKKINNILSKIGNLNSDGRPILGLDAKELLKIVSSTNSMLIPAHIWTPHFSLFGSESGFDTIEECFEDLSDNIYAMETGLSSNPKMNWTLSCLDKITLISNSDAHSPSKIGREANIFDTEISYKNIIDAIKTKNGFEGTVEFFPEEGKYHYDGHRNCGICFSPQETIQHNYKCPICNKNLTIGVMHRVKKLADREDNFKPINSKPFYSIIPLQEIIAKILKMGVNTKTVMQQYYVIIENIGNEIKILLDTAPEIIPNMELKNAIVKMRQNKVNISPGFDGEYGKIKIFEDVKTLYHKN